MDRREELLKSIWLAESTGAGSRLGVALLRHFGTVEQIYRQKPASAETWEFLTRKERGTVMMMLSNKSLDAAEKILRQCEEKDIRLALFGDLLYPASLRALPTAPMLLYYKGNMPILDRRFSVAVVGTRTMSDYGRRMAYYLGYGLTVGGALIISGMALGCDSVAMMGALDAGGTVVGVLGSGVDVIYPREHTHVYHRILDRGGCIVSEYPPGTEPKGRHFPVRNRIISGLSDAGVVVEGDSTSGALITAKNLIYQGRKLFAVPGQIGLAGSEGPNMLIRDGALPVLQPEDILCEFQYLFPDSIDINGARDILRRMDMEIASRQTVQNTGVGARSTHNYVGEGTYGGMKKKGVTSSVSIKPAKQPASPPTATTETSAPSLPWMQKTAAQVVANYAEPTEEMTPTEIDKVNMFIEKVRRKKTKKTEKQNDSSDFDNLSVAGSMKERTAEPAKKDVVPEKPKPLLDMTLLDDMDMRIFNKMKPNVPVTPDELAGNDMPVERIMAAMTTLEMTGVVEAGSGGYFLRTDPDDFPVMLVEDGEIAEKET